MIPDPPPLAILTGPTSVGKTEIAVAVAEALGTEIVSADSMAVYRRMEAATAKPTAAERARVIHHGIDLVDPTQPFTVADYCAAVGPILDRLRGEGRMPLVVGGTRLYLAALTSPFDTGPPPSPAFRETVAALPGDELHSQLRAIDPELAARLHPHDRKRLIRALEVWSLTGQPLSLLQRQSCARPGRYPARWVALIRDRQELYARVDARVDEMMANGLVDEVQGFLAEGLTPDTPAMGGHGYKEIMRALLGEYDMQEGVRLLKRNTRHYVKYQLLWLKNHAQVTLVRADRPREAVIEATLRIFRTHSSSCRDPEWVG